MSAEFGDPRLPEHFWTKVSLSPDGCWLWTAGKNGVGYGMFAVADRRKKLSHRLAYETLIDLVGVGLDLDHLCRVRRCCNPAHLEPVTRGENIRRGIGPSIAGQRQAAKTHCPRGHELSGNNVYAYRGKRGCKSCRGDQAKAYQQRLGAKEST